MQKKNRILQGNSLDILKKIPKFDSLNNFQFIKKISNKDYNKIFEDSEYNEESLITYSKYWIEAQKKINAKKF